MSVEDTNNVEEQGPQELEVPNLIEVVFPPVGKREPSYPKAAVDSVLQNAQEYIDRTAQYVKAYHELDEQYGSLVANYNQLSEQFESVVDENQNLVNRINELTEQVGQLEHANAALRNKAQEAAEAQNARTEPEASPDVVQSSALLQRATELAEGHINDARRQAAQIIAEAEESLASLKAETASLHEEKKVVIDSVVSFLSAKTEEFQARR